MIVRHKEFMVSLVDGSHFTTREVEPRIRTAFGKEFVPAIEAANPGAIQVLADELTKLIQRKGRAVAEAGVNEYVKEACSDLRDRYNRAIEEADAERAALAAERLRLSQSDPRFAWAEERIAALMEEAKGSRDRYALQQAIRSSGLIAFAALGGTSVGAHAPQPTQARSSYEDDEDWGSESPNGSCCPGDA
jgi:hypothetical protein